jgi:hypothetical protein
LKDLSLTFPTDLIFYIFIPIQPETESAWNRDQFRLHCTVFEQGRKTGKGIAFSENKRIFHVYFQSNGTQLAEKKVLRSFQVRFNKIIQGSKKHQTGKHLFSSREI